MPALPQIPYDPSQTVQPGGIPNDYLNVRANPEQFGSQVGEALQRTGAVTEQGADKASELALSYQQMNNQITANNLTTGYADWAGQQIMDFRTKFRGQNAAAQFPAFQQALRDQLQQTAQNIPSLPARAAFLQDARSFYDRATYNAGAYVSDEVNRATRESWAGSMKSTRDFAVLNFADPGSTQDAIDKTIDQALTLAQLDGVDAEAAHSRVSAATGAIIKDVISAQINQGSTAQENWDALQKGLDTFNNYKDTFIEGSPGDKIPYLDGEQQDQITSMLHYRQMLVQGELDRADAKQYKGAQQSITTNLSNASELLSKGVTEFDDSHIPTAQQIEAAHFSPERELQLKEQASDMLDVKSWFGLVKNMTPDQIEYQKEQLTKNFNPNANFEDAGKRLRLVDNIDHILAGMDSKYTAAQVAATLGEERRLTQMLPNMTADQAEQMRGVFADARLGTTNDKVDAGLEKADRAFDRAVTLHQKALAEDPAGYAIKNDVELRGKWQAAAKDPQKWGDYMNAIQSKLNLLGVPEGMQNVLPKEVATDWVRKIEGDPAHAADTLAGLQKQTGVYFAPILQTLVRLGKLSPQYQSVAMLDEGNGNILSQVLNSTKGEAGQKSIADLIPEVGTQKPEAFVTEQVLKNESIQSLMGSLGASRMPPAYAQGILESVKSLALGRMYFKHETPQDAVTNAVKAFTSQMEFVGMARIPSDKFPVVSTNMGNTIQKMDLSSVSIPKMIQDNEKHGVGTSSQEWLNTIKADPQWVTAPEGDKVYLMDPGGRYVRDTKGNPVSVKFSDPPGPSYKAPYKANPVLDNPLAYP